MPLSLQGRDAQYKPPFRGVLSPKHGPPSEPTLPQNKPVSPDLDLDSNAFLSTEKLMRKLHQPNTEN